MWRQELVAQSLALGGALDQSGDVHELDRRRNDDGRLRDLAKHARAVNRAPTTMPTLGSIVQKG